MVLLPHHVLKFDTRLVSRTPIVLKFVRDLKFLDKVLSLFQVFDGHGGVDAATFAQQNLLNYIVEDSHFPSAVKRAIRNAFVKADHALADAKSLDSSSGTTALAALMLGR